MKKILFVENHLEIINLMEIYSKKIGFELVVKEELEDILQACGDNDVVAVVLDIIMPEISGDLLIKRIREVYPDIPIIMNTALKSSEMKGICLENGANYYLTKPTSIEDIRDVVTQYL